MEFFKFTLAKKWPKNVFNPLYYLNVSFILCFYKHFCELFLRKYCIHCSSNKNTPEEVPKSGRKLGQDKILSLVSFKESYGTSFSDNFNCCSNLNINSLVCDLVSNSLELIKIIFNENDFLISRSM